MPFKFTGRAGEYFSIWIVNLCLSIVTLGLYSPWAKVRRRRYFYGNTQLEGAAFDYLADPKVILKGRLIVVAAFAAYHLASEVSAGIGLALWLLLAAALPWAIVKALRFNARNTAHRNVRFRFLGEYRGALANLAWPAFLTFITLGLAFPYMLYRKDKFFVQNSAFGATPFAFHATAGAYYFASLKIFAAGLGFLVGAIVTFGIGALPFYILARSYAIAAMGRLKWRSTTLADMRFECGWTAWGLFKLYFVNALAVLVSLGLLVPWAAIRSARYMLEGLSVHGELATFVAVNQEQVAALGDEVGELVGFDFGV